MLHKQFSFITRQLGALAAGGLLSVLAPVTAAVAVEIGEPEIRVLAGNERLELTSGLGRSDLGTAYVGEDALTQILWVQNVGLAAMTVSGSAAVATTSITPSLMTIEM